MHRLAVSRADFPSLDIMGLFMADIVPTVEQFASFADPAAAVGYYHWLLLPKGDMAVGMIIAYGGARFVQETFSGAFGGNSNEAGRVNLYAHGAVDVYASHWEKESVVRAGAEDYAAAATQDYQLQILDQKEGKKIDVPTLVLYSERNLGAMHDVPAVWQKWVKEGTRLEMHGIGENAGHFFLDEVPEDCLRLILDFIGSLGC